VSRVDLARNCLNAPLWEVIAYRGEGGGDKPFYHGWLDFPEPLYAAMFEAQNGVPYDRYDGPLETWKDPEKKQVDLSQLRSVERSAELEWKSLNDELYPLVGARKTKYENIVHPEEPESIEAMLADDTTFATFDQPGFYNTGNPRETKLGRLRNVTGVTLRETKVPALEATRYELTIAFEDEDGERVTELVVGGLDLTSLPRLAGDRTDKAWKMPMGVANHSFYESYAEAKKTPVQENPYYGLLLDGEGRFLDSHHVGIDGPLAHWDEVRERVLHVYILSFERHAFVGHFELTLPEGWPAPPRG
jgi:hypothetical protein